MEPSGVEKQLSLIAQTGLDGDIITFMPSLMIEWLFGGVVEEIRSFDKYEVDELVNSLLEDNVGETCFPLCQAWVWCKISSRTSFNFIFDLTNVLRTLLFLPINYRNSVLQNMFCWNLTTVPWIVLWYIKTSYHNTTWNLTITKNNKKKTKKTLKKPWKTRFPPNSYFLYRSTHFRDHTRVKNYKYIQFYTSILSYLFKTFHFIQ